MTDRKTEDTPKAIMKAQYCPRYLHHLYISFTGNGDISVLETNSRVCRNPLLNNVKKPYNYLTNYLMFDLRDICTALIEIDRRSIHMFAP